MKIQNTWTASNKDQLPSQQNALTDMLGVWNLGIHISFVNPCTYDRGPVEKKTVSDILRSPYLPNPTTQLIKSI